MALNESLWPDATGSNPNSGESKQYRIQTASNPKRRMIPGASRYSELLAVPRIFANDTDFGVPRPQEIWSTSEIRRFMRPAKTQRTSCHLRGHAGIDTAFQQCFWPRLKNLQSPRNLENTR